MVESGILVAIVAAITGAITVCLQKCRFLYEHHPEGTYELTIGFDRQVSNESAISQRTHKD
jgi:hypothetical protein